MLRCFIDIKFHLLYISILGATYLIRNVLTKPGALSKHLLEPFERILTVEDQSFLNKFLENNDLKNILTVSVFIYCNVYSY